MENNNFTIPEYDSKSLYPHKKCLSSSQVLCYEKDPVQFYTEYMLGAKKPPSVAMQTGSIFSALYQHRYFNFRKALNIAKAHSRIGDIFEKAMKMLPVQKGGYPEYPLKCEYKGWELRATLDDYIKTSYTVIENKTGQTVWDQDRANYSDQITFQSFVHWIKFGVPPRKILLNWLDLREKNSCRILNFKTSRSIKNLEMFEERIKAVINGIEAGNFTKKIYE